MNTRSCALMLLVTFAVAAVGAAELPQSFGQLPWVQSDGTAYIDTGYHLKAATRLEIDLDIMDIGGDYFPFGASDVKYGGDSAKMQLWWETYNNGSGYVGTPGTSGYYSKTTGSLGLSSSEFRFCHITYESGIITVVNTNSDTTCVYNGSAGFETSDSSYVFTNTLHLFCRKGSGSSTSVIGGIHSKSRFRRVKAFEGNDLVMDLVPAYAKSTSSLGMYDLIGDVFHADAGGSNGLFTEIQGNRKRLSFIGSSNAGQYIDSGYVFKTKPRVECGMYLNCTTDTDIMGTPQAIAGCFIIDISEGGKCIYYRYSTSSSTGSKSYSSTHGSLLKRWVDCVFCDTVTIDGIAINVGVSSWDFSQNNQTFHILNGRYANECVRFSWLKMYDGDVLVRDFIPAEVDGVVGFYDKLTQTLYRNAGNGTLEAGGAVPSQPGDFSILNITGSPREIGAVTPAYGSMACSEGMAVNASATAPAESATERSRIAGWELYYDGVLQTNGTDQSPTIACGPGISELRWIWTGDYKVSVTNGPHGSCTLVDDWLSSGTNITLTATADSAFEFLQWSGDVPQSTRYDNPLVLPVAGAMDITATFVSSNAKRIEYIGSDSSQQWIDTGYIPTNKPAVVARAMFKDTNDRDFLGMAQANANCFMVDYADGNKTIYYRYGSASYTAMNYSQSSGMLTDKWFDFAWSNIVWHGEYRILTVADGWEGIFAANTQKLKLFGGRSYGKIYYGPTKIYDGDELVRDFIPVKLNGVAGMWDRIGKRFYGNANANGMPFVEGPAVATEPGDFAVSHTISSGSGGSVSVSDPETPMGEPITLIATPQSGYVFSGWNGSIPAAYVADPNPTFVVTGPITAQAVFAKSASYVVDPSGEGDFTTLEDALEATAGAIGTIELKKGFYEVRELMHVTGGMKIEPESGVTGDVVLWTTNHTPIISLENQLSSLSHIVVSNGYTSTATSGYAGNVTISGGTVADCLIVNGHNGWSVNFGDVSNANGGPAAGVYITDGTLRNSTIRGNRGDYDASNRAVGILAVGANTLIENCDISCNTNLNNYNLDYLYDASAIKLVGGTVRNCTITNNVNSGESTIHVSNGGRVEDTLVKDNVSGFYFETLSGGAMVPAGSAATFVRCTFTGNSGFGVGGICNAGVVNLVDVKCYGNICAAADFEGAPNVRGIDLSKVDLSDPRVKPARVSEVRVNPGDNIEDAIECCATSGTVFIAAGDYPLKKGLFIDRAMTLKGEGYGRTSIFPDAASPFIRALNLRDDGIVVEGLAITNGSYLAANCVNLVRGTVRNCLIGHSKIQGSLLIRDGKVQNCVIEDCKANTAYSDFGTAVHIAGDNGLLEDSIIRWNKQMRNVYAARDVILVCNGKMRRCEIRGNEADGNGTAVVGIRGGAIENCTVHDNDSSWNGLGMIKVDGSGWQIRNCTVVSNRAWFGGAVWWATNGNARARSGAIVNTIFRGNWSKVLTERQALADLGEIFPGNGTANIDVVFSNCCFETSATIAKQGARATGCISGDPRFRNLASKDFRLSIGSPCRRAGVLWDGAKEASDPNGRPVTWGNVIDIGAYSCSKKGIRFLVK